MKLRTSEWIAIGYFFYLGAAALAFRVSARRRGTAVAVALFVVITVLAVVSADISRFGKLFRDWMPLVWILAGYWLPPLLVTGTNGELEKALLGLDHRWLGAPGRNSLTQRMPRALVEALEVAYLFCYPLVPAGFAFLYLAGLRAEADRFWTAALLAVFACYGLLPWLPTQPPRVLEAGLSPAGVSATRRLNLQVLDRASIHLNTFPSGHAAAAVATTLAVGARLPWAGFGFGVVAIGICVGSVVGRYHYAADALTGALVAIIAFVVSRAL